MFLIEVGHIQCSKLSNALESEVLSIVLSTINNLVLFELGIVPISIFVLSRYWDDVQQVR